MFTSVASSFDVQRSNDYRRNNQLAARQPPQQQTFGPHIGPSHQSNRPLVPRPHHRVRQRMLHGITT